MLSLINVCQQGNISFEELLEIKNVEFQNVKMKEVLSLVFRIRKEEISFKRKNNILKLKRYKRFANKLSEISIFPEYNEKHNPLQTLVEPCTFENFVRKLSTKK